LQLLKLYCIEIIEILQNKTLPSKRAAIVHLTFKSFLSTFALEMRCTGLVLIPDRHAKVCLVGLTHLTTCFHAILSRSCLYNCPHT